MLTNTTPEENPMDVKIARLEKRVRRMNRKLSRQTEGSNNSKRTIQLLDKSRRRLYYAEKAKQGQSNV